MPAQQYMQNYACTPAQYITATTTTLPAAGFTVIKAPNNFTGIIIGNTGGSAGLGQVDFQYDGQYFLRFFGANLAPVAEQAQAGIPQSMLTSQMLTYLNATLLATLGAPVVPNLAIPANYVS